MGGDSDIELALICCCWPQDHESISLWNASRCFLICGAMVGINRFTRFVLIHWQAAFAQDFFSEAV